jgi:ABC-2 type transport system permease protein
MENEKRLKGNTQHAARFESMRRYFKLFILFIKIGLMRQMAYRPHFFMMVAGKVIRIGLLFFFFQAIFFKVDRIGQWTFDQVLLLFATFHIVDFLISITFQRNLSFHLPRLIQTGELDSRMVLPANLLFFISFEDIDLMDFFSFLPSLGFLGYVFYRIGFSFSSFQAMMYVLLLINALIFIFAMVLLIATVSFYTTQSYGMAKIFDNLLKIGRYPLDIFEGFWKIIFIYFLPLVLIAQIPAQALLQTLSLKFTLFAFGVTFVSLILALNFWKIGLRNYLSAST